MDEGASWDIPAFTSPHGATPLGVLLPSPSQLPVDPLSPSEEDTQAQNFGLFLLGQVDIPRSPRAAELKNPESALLGSAATDLAPCGGREMQPNTKI